MIKKAKGKKSKNIVKASFAFHDDWDSETTIAPALILEDKKETILASRRTTKSDFGNALNEYPNIDAVGDVFSSWNDGQFIDARQIIRRATLAYWAYPLLRNVLEVMQEIANGEIRLKGGTKSVNDFIYAWFKKIRLSMFSEQWFRSFWREGGAYIFPVEGKFTQEEQNKLNKVYGSTIKGIPVYYGLLNPCSISSTAQADPRFRKYVKVLNPYEIDSIKKLLKKGEIASLSMFDKEELRLVSENKATWLTIAPDKLICCLLKAQPYEPMGIPLAWGAVKDIEAKLELRRIDLSIARSIDRAILHIRVGETPNEWNKGKNVNPLVIQSLQELFTNYSVARTLVSDYTVKAEWVIPDISGLLSQEKYKQIDADISAGLNAVIFEPGEKFANTSVKIQIFIERLRSARRAFLNGFLQPEIEKICEKLNAKKIPLAEFEDFNLSDSLQYAKLAQSLAQLGLLTPEETFDAIRTGEFPQDIESSLESQRKFKDQRDEGLYMPLVGSNPVTQAAIADQQAETAVRTKSAAPVGRPTGSKAPKIKTTPTPIGTSKAAFSVKKLTELTQVASVLQDKVEKEILAQKKLKKTNSDIQGAALSISLAIISNENQKDWVKSATKYVKELKEVSRAAQEEIDDICIRFEATPYQAALLRLCKTEPPE